MNALPFYEPVSIALFLLALAWALRSGNPINLGAVLGGFMLFGFDWMWCSRGFWNATVAQNLIMVPGLHIQGQRYPIAIACNWSVGYGLLPLLLSKAQDTLSRRLGALHLPVMLLFFAALDIAIEALLISVLHVYAYHQAPQFMIWGVVWSNAWMLGGLLTAGYFGLARAESWAAIPPGSGISLAREETWKGILMAAGTILTAAFLLGVVQFFWFSAATPWVESGRLF